MSSFGPLHQKIILYAAYLLAISLFRNNLCSEIIQHPEVSTHAFFGIPLITIKWLHFPHYSTYYYSPFSSSHY